MCHQGAEKLRGNQLKSSGGGSKIVVGEFDPLWSTSWSCMLPGRIIAVISRTTRRQSSSPFMPSKKCFAGQVDHI